MSAGVPPSSSGTTRAQDAAILLLASAAFFSGAALRVCDAMLPRLAADFDIAPGVAGQVIIGFSVAYGLMQLLFGPLGDRYGKTRMMCVALYGCAIAALASTLAPGFGALVLARWLWGMAAAGVIPLAMAWIGDNVDYADRQATLARFLTGTLSGMAAGQLAGGLFADSAIGWRGAFALLGVGFCAVATLLLLRVPHGPVPLASVGQPRASFLDQLRGVLQVRWARVVLLTVGIEGVFLLGPMSYLPSLLHQRHGIALATAAAMIALYGIGGLVYALTARRIVAALGEHRMALCGGLVMGACYLAWLLAPPWWLSAPIALALGFGTYLFHNTLQTHATQMAPGARGTSVSLFSFCLFGGQALGVTLSGWTVDHLGYRPMLATAALALPLAGWGFATALRRRAGILASS
jgi:predicted MFS family arabinose efflux permease